MIIHVENIDYINRTGVGSLIEFDNFPGGEIYVNVDNYDLSEDRCPTIYAELYSSNDIMALMHIIDAYMIVARNPRIKLILPYLPYGRQDRVFTRGESFGLKIISDLINYFELYKVVLLDEHSSVSSAVIDNCSINRTYMYQIPEIIKKYNIDCLVCPDAGAQKRLDKLTQIPGLASIPQLNFTKRRINGSPSLKMTPVLDHDYSKFKNFLIVDDLCDGGKTFTRISEIIKENHGGGDVYLYVSHAIKRREESDWTPDGIKEMFEYKIQWRLK